MLASLPKQNNFAVPADYFVEGLPDAALAGIIEEKLYPLKNTNPFVTPENNFEEGTAYLAVMAEIFIEPYHYLKENNVFKTPSNYFDELSDLIVSQVNGEVSENISFANGTPKFSVPKDYFNKLSDVIIDKVKQEDAPEITLNPLLKQMQGEAIFKLPANYFNGLDDRIIDRVNQEDAPEIVLNPLLKQMQGEDIFKLPSNYFNGLDNRILEQIKAPKIKQLERTEAKVVKFPLQRVMAIAAMLALFLGGAWLIQNSGLNSNVSLEDQFAALSSDDIKEYINDNEFEFDGYLLAEAASNELNDNLFEGVQLNDSELDFYLNNIDDDILNEWYNENAI